MTPEPAKIRYSIREVRDAYARERRITELEGELPAVLLYRPVSHMVTPLFLRLGLSPLSVTLVNGAIAMGLGEPPLEPVTEWPPRTLLARLRVATAGLEDLYVFALVIGGALGRLGEIFLGMAIYVASMFPVPPGAVFRKAALRGGGSA